MTLLSYFANIQTLPASRSKVQHGKVHLPLRLSTPGAYTRQDLLARQDLLILGLSRLVGLGHLVVQVGRVFGVGSELDLIPLHSVNIDQGRKRVSVYHAGEDGVRERGKGPHGSLLPGRVRTGLRVIATLVLLLSLLQLLGARVGSGRPGSGCILARGLSGLGCVGVRGGDGSFGSGVGGGRGLLSGLGSRGVTVSELEGRNQRKSQSKVSKSVEKRRLARHCRTKRAAGRHRDGKEKTHDSLLFALLFALVASLNLIRGLLLFYLLLLVLRLLGSGVVVVVVSVVSVAGLRLSEVVNEVASDGKEDGCGSELADKGSEERER